MDKWLKNIDTVDGTYFGQLIKAGEYYKIDHSLWGNFTACDSVKNAINNDKLKASTNGTTTIDDKGMGIAYLYSKNTECYLLFQGLETPASSTAAGITGMVCIDANYIYVCTATDTWKRIAISTW